MAAAVDQASAAAEEARSAPGVHLIPRREIDLLTLAFEGIGQSVAFHLDDLGCLRRMRVTADRKVLPLFSRAAVFSYQCVVSILGGIEVHSSPRLAAAKSFYSR
jgi:hypothetical protein